MNIPARIQGFAFLIGFALCIPAANWMIGNLGSFCVPNGPCLIPVAPGIMAPSGVLMIGLALVLRDLVQRRLGLAWAFGAILAGTARSVLGVEIDAASVEHARAAYPLPNLRFMQGDALRLPVNGRFVDLPRFANGIARASFWDLCARPLGPADYLAIAQSVRVLILEDIPQLSSSNYNEAKRFVTLIDALYEAKVRLICSAADEPERLYIEGEGSFEFERTASRLREMQAADWGA
jgi:hypothetical protein